MIEEFVMIAISIVLLGWVETRKVGVHFHRLDMRTDSLSLTRLFCDEIKRSRLGPDEMGLRNVSGGETASSISRLAFLVPASVRLDKSVQEVAPEIRRLKTDNDICRDGWIINNAMKIAKVGGDRATACC
jgi:hypothetical protein